MKKLFLIFLIMVSYSHIGAYQLVIKTDAKSYIFNVELLSTYKPQPVKEGSLKAPEKIKGPVKAVQEVAVGQSTPCGYHAISDSYYCMLFGQGQETDYKGIENNIPVTTKYGTFTMTAQMHDNVPFKIKLVAFAYDKSKNNKRGEQLKSIEYKIDPELGTKTMNITFNYNKITKFSDFKVTIVDSLGKARELKPKKL